MSKVKITKKTVKNIVAVLLAILISFGAIFGLVKLFSNNETAMKKVSPTVFSVGGLNVKGEHIDTDDTLYSELIECRGLTIEQDFESHVKYQVFYYNEDKVFIGRSDELKNTAYEIEDKYDIAKFCRIVINPMQLGDDSETFKIKFWEVLSYADDLTIKVYEKQNFVSPNLLSLAVVKSYSSGISTETKLMDFNSNNCILFTESNFSFTSINPIEITSHLYKNVLGFKVDSIGSLQFVNSYSFYEYNDLKSNIVFVFKDFTLARYVLLSSESVETVAVPDGAMYCFISYDTSKSLSVKKYTLR